MCRRALSQLCARSSVSKIGVAFYYQPLLLPLVTPTPTLHQHSQVFRVLGHRSRAATPRQIL